MATQKDSVYIPKTILVGPPGVGKSLLLAKLSGKKLANNHAYEATEGMDYKKIFNEDKSIRSSVFEICGNTQWRRSSTAFFSGPPSRVYIVLDPTNLNSIDSEKLKKEWIDWILQHVPNQTPIGLIINYGNNLGEPIESLQNKVSELLKSNSVKSVIKPENIVYVCPTNDDDIANLKDKLLKEPEVAETSEVGFITHPQPKKISLRQFFVGHATSNAICISVLGWVGMIVLGALGTALSLVMFKFLMFSLLILASASLVFGIAHAFHQSNFNDSQKIPFFTWAKAHWLEVFVGVLLLLAAVTTMILAVFFPMVLATIPFFSAVVDFVSSGLIGMGLVGASAPVMGLIASSVIMVLTMTLWDLACRIKEAISPVKISTVTSLTEDPNQITTQVVTNTKEKKSFFSKIFQPDTTPVIPNIVSGQAANHTNNTNN